MPHPLFRAIKDGNLAVVRRALDELGPDYIGADGYSVLYYACMKPSVDVTMIEGILRLGASVDMKGKDDETPLYVAIFNRRLDVAQLLQRNGANVNITNGVSGDTVLHVAARLGYPEIVTWLLRYGASLNVRNNKQETPLFAAASAGRHETVYSLVEAGANAQLANADGKNPLYIASERGHKHVVVILKANRSELRHARAEAELILRNHAKPLMSSDEIVERAIVDDDFHREVHAKVEPPVQAASTEPLPIVDIKIPEAHTRIHDPFTGKTSGPCRSLEEVGRDMPPPIPKELQTRPPAKLSRIGGTSMVVGTSVGSSGVRPIRVDSLPSDILEDYLHQRGMR